MNKQLTSYHIESKEAKEQNNGVCLSLESLDNNRPLFLCNNPEEWWPSHLDTDGYSIYEIAYNEPPNIYKTKNYDVYHKLFKYTDDELNKCVFSEQLIIMIKCDTHLFELEKNNDKKELSELFLIFPKQYITSIRKVDIQVHC